MCKEDYFSFKYTLDTCVDLQNNKPHLLRVTVKN